MAVKDYSRLVSNGVGVVRSDGEDGTGYGDGEKKKFVVDSVVTYTTVLMTKQIDMFIFKPLPREGHISALEINVSAEDERKCSIDFDSDAGKIVLSN